MKKMALAKALSYEGSGSSDWPKPKRKGFGNQSKPKSGGRGGAAVGGRPMSKKQKFNGSCGKPG
jgi:hypothetical protein